ncbi:MAG: flagellar protein FlaG [Lachnospiraceae bacterium]|nr:flagellar protein FlaG [Lachnospiraceae bacterium]
MGMEPINSISSIQAQTVMRPVTPPKVSNEVAEGTASNVTVPKIDNTTVAVAKSQEQGGKQGYENQENSQQPNPEEVRKAVENLNKNLQNAEAIFGIHDKTNRVTIKIVDKKTKELIKELPPEKTLDMIAKAWELAGLLVDEKR